GDRMPYRRRSMNVQMELSRILIREVVDHQIIELREKDAVDESDARRFPIVIGLPEAQAIERRLKGIDIKRPQTHDLLASVIERLGAELESICINDLSEHTFFALLTVRDRDGDLIEIDSRPSDAIALGIAGSVPIFVAEHVLESASQEPL
ncbi:MAG: bifunctional nuclease family protein, partial [Phycisphaerales bacterium]|nr:bifunctional nuclease family protein [Phycisphaerales bacterium]